MKAEKELGKFLDKYFYPNLDYKSERKMDRSSQFQGIDVQLKKDNYQLNIDEKAQLYYINKSLPTFAFEVNFVNRAGNLAPGWLFNNDLQTDYYLLIWPFANTDDLIKIKEESFTKIDCLMISKKKIQQYLLQEGLTKEIIMEDAIKIRNGKQKGRFGILGKSDIYYFFSPSDKYTEVPINIVIRRNILDKLSEARYIVTNNGVELKKND